MNPIDSRRSERALLASVHRWARTNGWRIDRTFGWVNGETRDATVNVKWGDDEIGIARAIDRLAVGPLGGNGRAVWSNTTWIKVRSVVEAVDVLVALGVLPPFLSSAFGMAEDRYREQVETLTEELQRAQGVYRDVVAGWAERADMFTVGPRVEIGGPR